MFDSWFVGVWVGLYVGVSLLSCLNRLGKALWRQAVNLCSWSTLEVNNKHHTFLDNKYLPSVFNLHVTSICRLARKQMENLAASSSSVATLNTCSTSSTGTEEGPAAQAPDRPRGPAPRAAGTVSGEPKMPKWLKLGKNDADDLVSASEQWNLLKISAQWNLF